MSKRSIRSDRGEGAFKAIVGIALVIVGVMAGIKVVPLHVHGGEVLDAMEEQANFGSLKPPDKIQYEVFRKAQEVEVPLQLNDIKVYKNGANIIIEAKYKQAVDVLGYRYVYDFDKKVEKPTF